MAVNRRKKKKRLHVQGRRQSVNGVIPGKILGVLVLLTIFSLGYLYVCSRCVALGDKISELENKRDALKREIHTEEFKWSGMTSAENMERLMKKHGLEMIWPSGDSVSRLQRDPPPHLYAEGPRGELVHD